MPGMGRVEQRPDGWYETDAEVVHPLLMDVFRAGGFIDAVRQLQRRVADLERRGA